LRKFPAWLYSLQPKKVSDPIKRAKIISFKEECDYISGYVESEWKTVDFGKIKCKI
ncbi:hypothetical protein F9873_12040, partial [Glaesserella parasuis]|nr:hypothetical protein [Glaesserella parasuis]